MERFKNIKLVIFDMDGTLYPADEELNRVYPEICIKLVAKYKKLSFREAEKDFNQKKESLRLLLCGRPSNTLTLFKYYDVPFAEYEDMVNQRMNIEEKIKFDKKAFEVIKLVSENFIVHLHTTNNARCTNRILKVLKMDEIFPEGKRLTLSHIARFPVEKSEKLDYIKPGKKGFELILNMYKVKNEESLMVGDSDVSDIMPARELNLYAYKISTIEDLYNLPAYLPL